VTRFTIASFTIASVNVKNLIGADRDDNRFQPYTPEEYVRKRDYWRTR
jgi:hypothetical protein